VKSNVASSPRISTRTPDGQRPSSTPSSSSQSSPVHTPSGSAADGRPHRRLRRRVQRLETRAERVGAVALDQLAEPARRHVVGRELGEDVAAPLVGTAQIREDEVDLLLVRPGGREGRIGEMRTPS